MRYKEILHGKLPLNRPCNAENPYFVKQNSSRFGLGRDRRTPSDQFATHPHTTIVTGDTCRDLRLPCRSQLPTNHNTDGMVIPDGMTLAQFRLGWITITHVCSLWRHIALDHCTLWTHHLFNLGLEWTTEILRRAGGAPLKLSFSEQAVPYPPSEDNVANVIPRLLHRVSTLTIEERACTSAVLDTLTLPAPLMRSLTISASRLAVLPQSLFGDVVLNLHHLFLAIRN